MANLEIIPKMTPLREIENHLERCDARIKRGEFIEAIHERDRLIELVIKANIAIVSILCALYAIGAQFGGF